MFSSIFCFYNAVLILTLRYSGKAKKEKYINFCSQSTPTPFRDCQKELIFLSVKKWEEVSFFFTGIQTTNLWRWQTNIVLGCAPLSFIRSSMLHELCWIIGIFAYSRNCLIKIKMNTSDWLTTDTLHFRRELFLCASWEIFESIRCVKSLENRPPAVSRFPFTSDEGKNIWISIPFSYFHSTLGYHNFTRHRKDSSIC